MKTYTVKEFLNPRSNKREFAHMLAELIIFSAKLGIGWMLIKSLPYILNYGPLGGVGL